jgi:glycosyltransferase involved in cell wall biosynthesis
VPRPAVAAGMSAAYDLGVPPEQPFSIVCLSSQPWSASLPTNRQQIMLRAAEAGHEVLFVETGSFVATHIVAALRGDRAAARRLFAAERVAARISVRKAVNVIPLGHKYGWANRVNWALTSRLLRRSARRLRKPVVLWIYDPYAAPCRLGETFAVYDCVDDYPEQAGPDSRRRALASRRDSAAASRSRIVFATARPLLERHQRTNPHTHLVRNVGDFRHFAPAADRDHGDPEALALARPVLGFAGNFSASKVDLELLDSLARLRPDWTVLLIGPGRSETERKLAEVAGLPNVTWLGPKSYDELPRYVAAFDVALIPYQSNEYTKSCFPLKLFEYLAAGKPVVATGLPELAGMEPDVVVSEGEATAVAAAVEAALALRSDDDRRRRMEIAAANTWETRAGRLLGLVADELAASP